MEDFKLLNLILPLFTMEGRWGSKQILIYGIAAEIVWKDVFPCLYTLYDRDGHDMNAG